MLVPWQLNTQTWKESKLLGDLGAIHETSPAPQALGSTPRSILISKKGGTLLFPLCAHLQELSSGIKI